MSTELTAEERQEAETLRALELVKTNLFAAGREILEARHGQVWDPQQMQEDFVVLDFSAPFAVVQRRSDEQIGSLKFQHHPRFYFSFEPHVED